MLTTYNGFKLGDRVYYAMDNDYGVISINREEVFFEDTFYEKEMHVWVKWESNGHILHIPIKDIIKVGESQEYQEEQKAVALLLSLGYTLSKITK